MLCDRESLLTNRTRDPAAISTLRGLAPELVIVIVFVCTGGPGSVPGVPLHDRLMRIVMSTGANCAQR